MERCVQIILERCRSGVEKRLRYVIYNRRIWSRSSGWVQKAYTGSNPHDKHAHFSFLYGSGSSTTNPENITSPYGLLAERQRELDEAKAREEEEADIMAGVSEEQLRGIVRAAVIGVLVDAATAATGGAGGESASDREKRKIRNALVAVVGGPTEDDVLRAEQEILAEIRQAHPTEPATPPVS
jgi:hypothetical protein